MLSQGSARGVGSGGSGVLPAPDIDLRPFEWWGDLPSVEFLLEPYLPKGFALLVVGPAESGKSIWILDLASKLSREDRNVVVVSQENPAVVEQRRLLKLGADRSLVMYHQQGFDLARRDHAQLLHDTCEGKDLVVIDTLTECWRGDENDSKEVADFFATVVRPLLQAKTTVVVIHHTGHTGKDFSRTKTARAGRGSSAFGDKADMVLVLEPSGSGFRVACTKNRASGGVDIPTSFYKLVDRDDGSLEILLDEEGGTSRASRVDEAEEAILRTLSSDPRGRGEVLSVVRDATGVSDSTFNKALGQLETKGAAERDGHGGWRLAERTVGGDES